MPQLGLHEAGLAAPLLAGQQGDQEVLKPGKPGMMMMIMMMMKIMIMIKIMMK